MSEGPSYSTFPSIAQYDEAMLHPSAYLRVDDPDLREGNVLLSERVNDFGVEQEPWKDSGAFAVVYKFCKAPGLEQPDHLAALRCFTVPVSDDVAERYALLGPYLRSNARAITASMKFVSDGVLVRMDDDSFQVCPLLIMDWVEGVTLGKALDRYCRAGDRGGVDRLFGAWVDLLYCLHDAHIAHGDLAAGNVLVGAGDRLTLIDYDGCFIPGLTGRDATVNGQPDFQHPHTGQRRFDERMDDFSALLIGAAMLALRAEPALWQRFADKGPADEWQGEQLLFTRQDLSDPEASPVFRAIDALDDIVAKAAGRALKRACQQAIDETPVALSILDAEFPLRQALKLLQSAVDEGDADAILAAWGPALDHYAPAQPFHAQVLRAREHAAAHSRLRAASDIDGRAHMAQRRFLAAQQPTAAVARRSGDVIEVRWTWPASPLIDTVAVALSRVGPPDRPPHAGELAVHVTRAEYQQHGGFRASVAGPGPLYVGLFAALPATGATDGASKWAYPDVLTPGSRAVARDICRVRCRLLKRRGSPRNALELRTQDGGPLPELVVVRAAGLLPLSPREGVAIYHYPDHSTPAAGRALFEFDVRGWPARSVLRVFPKDPADEPWVQIDGEHGIRLEVS